MLSDRIDIFFHIREGRYSNIAISTAFNSKKLICFAESSLDDGPLVTRPEEREVPQAFNEESVKRARSQVSFFRDTGLMEFKSASGQKFRSEIASSVRDQNVSQSSQDFLSSRTQN